MERSARQRWARARWRRSSRSGTGADCVEVAWADGLTGVRDSKRPDGPVLEFSRAAWLAFLSSAPATSRTGSGPAAAGPASR
ncbi:DUF397 domain-containing protein [Crossiella sp. CA-258035]|uniref:DUF397 domain-containing protein n=1 Tax=Crossiella sp. CA-258035 TaxID=2981138 RepID=UPI0024BCA5F8|nr:DUF397 domain-containing protein [Crossiella sp. CA-258035]WHT15802.1 DUF397 domain-containing protein [Crossiella sp. CA-258035]